MWENEDRRRKNELWEFYENAQRSWKRDDARNTADTSSSTVTTIDSKSTKIKTSIWRFLFLTIIPKSIISSGWTLKLAPLFQMKNACHPRPDRGSTNLAISHCWDDSKIVFCIVPLVDGQMYQFSESESTTIQSQDSRLHGNDRYTIPLSSSRRRGSTSYIFPLVEGRN